MMDISFLCDQPPKPAGPCTIKAAGVFGKRKGQDRQTHKRTIMPTVEEFEADFCDYLRRLACNDDTPGAATS